MKKVFITGTAGFIGFHLVRRLLLDREISVVAADCINNYYDVSLKYARLAEIGFQKEDISEQSPVQSRVHSNLFFQKLDLQNRSGMEKLFSNQNFDYVINLAAQAGVRHSLKHPEDYVDNNITGFLNILELCRKYSVKHLLYASSSSVYGLNRTQPFSASHPVDHPMSMYAASKRANELMAHTYSHLFGIPSTGLRFFSVYGPWGRPDMAMFIFTRAILAGESIDLFNYGKMKRDFTYIDDITESVYRLMERIPSAGQNTPDLPSMSSAPFRIFNIGNNRPVELMHLIGLIENELGMEAKKNFMEMQVGDVPEASADIDSLTAEISYSPATSIETGVHKFMEWYKNFYKV